MRVAQPTPPMTLKMTNVRYCILDAPATMGAKVRTMGTNRARMIVLEPCCSKKSSACCRCFCLKKRESGRLNSDGPTCLPKP